MELVPERDWAEIPADLLLRIFGSLEVPDLLSVAAVCRSWRFGYKLDYRLDISPLLKGPCLVYSAVDCEADVATLHCLSDDKCHHITLHDPPFRTQYVVGSSHGWLVTANEQSDLSLVNPVTRAQIALPPAKTMKNLVTRFTSKKALHSYVLYHMDLKYGARMYEQRESFDPDEARFFLYKRIALSADPSSGNCIVLIIHMFHDQLSFARIGDASWTWIHGEQRYSEYQDIFCNTDDCLFYAIRGTGEVHTIDLSGPSPVVKVIFKEVVNCIYNNKYVVKAPWGDLIQIWREDDIINDGEWITKKLVVYKMDLVEQKVVEVKDLQGYALFLGFNSSFFLPVTHFPMLKANCIYHTDDDMEYIFSQKLNRRHIVAFNLNENSFTEFLPSSSRLNWPPTILLYPHMDALAEIQENVFVILASNG